MPPTGLTPNAITDRNDAGPSFVERLKRLAARHRADERTYEQIGYGYLAGKAGKCAERVERQIEQFEKPEDAGG